MLLGLKNKKKNVRITSVHLSATGILTRKKIFSIGCAGHCHGHDFCKLDGIADLGGSFLEVQGYYWPEQKGQRPLRSSYGPVDGLRDELWRRMLW